MAPWLAWGSRPRPEVYPFSKAPCTGCALAPPPPVESYSRAVVSARPHLLLGLALFAASFTLALVFAATGRAEDTALTPDVGTATAADNAGAVPTPTVDGSPAADGTSGPTTDPAPAPPTDTVPPPTDTVPPPTDTVPPPTDSPHDPLGVLGPSPGGVPVASPGPGSDALVAIVFGSPDSPAPPVNDRSGGVAAAPGHSRGAPGQPWLPTDSPGPSAPASAPAGSGGAPGGGFFFSGFAALVAAVCFGLAGRSTKRLITSVVAWEPVAFVSLPERPG